MRRPPCCDKVGIKKGPWTPEEDIILVSYIQEHGPGNWRSVPTNTGLMRCSKSCRLRWTNYLRPGIKRGNFTPHEEGIIIHLQAMLGNRWASIASYLPQRTDNDIKNYWNTHLKKKIRKFQTALDTHIFSANSSEVTINESKLNHRRYDLVDRLCPTGRHCQSSSSTYASSADNISKLLEGWVRSSPPNNNNKSSAPTCQKIAINPAIDSDCDDGISGVPKPAECNQLLPKAEHVNGDIMSQEELESLLSFENASSCLTFDKSSDCSMNEIKQRIVSHPPLSLLEKWLLDEAAAQEEEMMVSEVCHTDSLF